MKSRHATLLLVSIGLLVALLLVYIMNVKGRGDDRPASTSPADSTTTLPALVAVKAAPELPAARGEPLVSTSAALPSVKFDDGTVATLAGVRFYYEKDNWWGADGSTVSPAPHEIRHSIGGFETETNRAVEFRVDLIGQLRGKSVSLRFGGKQDGASNNHVGGWPRQMTHSNIFSFPREQMEVELEVGIPRGEYVDVDKLTVAEAPARAELAKPFAGKPDTLVRAATAPATGPVIDSPYWILSVTGVENATHVEFTDRDYRPDWRDGWPDWRAVVITKAGRTLRYKKVDHIGRRMIFIYDVPLDDVESAIYQTRPHEWKSLGKIRLQPGQL